MAHREGIREFLKDVEVSGLVYDWGCGTKPIKNYLKPNSAKFIGIDQLEHVKADVVKNFGKEWVNFEEKSDYAFCLEVIEHVWDSRKLLENIWRNMKDGGILYLSQPYMYETHKEDDRIRYTHHGLRQLLEENGFDVLELKGTGGEENKEWGFVMKAVKR